MSDKVVALKQALMKPSQLDQFEMALPASIPKDKFIRVALTCINKIPKLAECTPASVVTCLLDLASIGLEPDGRHAHLIPFGKQCQLIVDFKGMIKLGRESGELADWYAEIVCDKDEFSYTNGQVDHSINFREPRGDAYCAFSCAIFKDGLKSFCVMTKEEIEGIKKRSKASSSGPWKTDEMEMWKKTVVRRHSKTLPLSSSFKKAAEKDYDSIDIEPLHVSPPMPQRTTEKVSTPEVMPPEEPAVNMDSEPPEDDNLPFD